jgi:hypothetical protein
MLKLLKNNLVMGRLVTSQFKNEFKKIGNTVYVKRPPEFIIRDGAIADVQPVVEGEVPVVIDKQKGIDISFTSLEETLTVDDLLKNAIMNAEAAQLAQQIDTDLMSETFLFNNWVGTPGETINSAADFFKGPERLDDIAVPQSERSGVLSTRDYWATASFFTSATFNDNDINRQALEKAKLPTLGSVQPYMTQSVQNLTTGDRHITNGDIFGNNQNVNYVDVADSYVQELDLDQFAAGATFKRGEVFTIANVYAVNPRTKATLDYLQQFVVQEDAVADGGGAVTLSISPPIIVPNTGGTEAKTNSAFATVNAAPVDNATITFMGAASTAYRQNSVFHKMSIALVFAKLIVPYTGEASYATDPETGISIRYWRTSDGINDTHLHRWDVLYGTKMLDNRLGTRISGTGA